MRALRTGLTFNLLLVIASAWAGPYVDVDTRLQSLNKPGEVLALLAPLCSKDETLNSLCEALAGKPPAQAKESLDAVRSYVDIRARAEVYKTDGLAKSQSVQIKASPLYHDERLQSSNWFAKAATNLWELIKKWLHLDKPKKQRDFDLPTGIFGPWLIWVAWGFIFALAAVFGYFAIRQARWKVNLKRRAKAMLEEDEPERTLDEWLVRADELEARGLYREAVRCLYLACLLRFDEARIARFDRGQTNWEHLRRIQASPLLPRGMDFEPITHSFDRVWYGMITRGADDVSQFRAWYVEITEALRKPLALSEGDAA